MKKKLTRKKILNTLVITDVIHQASNIIFRKISNVINEQFDALPLAINQVCEERELLKKYEEINTDASYEIIDVMSEAVQRDIWAKIDELRFEIASKNL